MATGYTLSQLEGLWTQAGGRPDTAAVAAAVAMAESSGNPNAVSATGDYGLWQINEQNFSTHNLNMRSALDPLSNARTAVAMSNSGTNWACWCTAWSDPKNCGCAHGPLSNPQQGSPAAGFLPAGASLGAASSNSSGVDLSACVFKLNLPLIGGCLVTKGNVKWLKGAVLTVAGANVFLLGALVLAAYGYKASGAQSALRQARSVTPAGVALGRISSAANRRSPGRSAPARSEPLSSGDLEDLNTEMRAKRAQSEGDLGPRFGSSEERRRRARRVATGTPGGRPMP